MIVSYIDKSPNERLTLKRWLYGFLWFILFITIFFFGVIESVWFYSHYVASGEEAIKLDRELSEIMGGTIGSWVFFVIAILTARYSVKGKLPGTGEFK